MTWEILPEKGASFFISGDSLEDAWKQSYLPYGKNVKVAETREVTEEADYDLDIWFDE